MPPKPSYEDLEQRIKELEKTETERKRAEEGLKDSREFFRFLSESSLLGVFQTDEAGSVLYLNSKWLEITGMAIDDALGSGWSKSLHPEDRSWVLKEWAKCLKEGIGYDGEFRFVRPNGGVRWTHTRTSPVFSPTGDVMSHVGVNEDITERKPAELELALLYTELEQRIVDRTIELNRRNKQLELEINERKQAEEELRKSEGKIRELVETMNEGLATMDENKRITFVNDSFCRMLGYSQDELIGLLVTDLHDEANQQVLREQLDRRAQGERSPYELAFVRKDGRQIIATVSPKPLFDDDGSFRGSFSLFVDITKRKQNEELIRSSLREKEVLLREVHHRVKNNLQVTSSLLALSKDETMGHEALDKLSEARNRINTMALIHTQLYDGKHLDSIHIANHLQKLSVHLLQTYNGSKQQIRIVVEPSEVRLPLTQSVPCCLAVNEILTNACKHAFKDRNEGRVSVSFENGEGDMISIRIRDNGPGIPTDVVENADNTVGLNLARRLVEDQLKGTILFEVNDGTDVTIRFEVDGLGTTAVDNCIDQGKRI